MRRADAVATFARFAVHWGAWHPVLRKVGSAACLVFVAGWLMAPGTDGYPSATDYSGFMDFVDGAGVVTDSQGPMAGNPQVGFPVPASPGGPFVTRVTDIWPAHWSRTLKTTAQLIKNLWWIGTDGTENGERFGFYDITSTPFTPGPIVDVRLRNGRVENTSIQKDFHWRCAADAWFYFRIKINSTNWVPGDAVYFQINMDNTGDGANWFFRDGMFMNWSIYKPMYRIRDGSSTTEFIQGYKNWKRGVLVAPLSSANEEDQIHRTAWGIYKIEEIPDSCAANPSACQIEVALSIPYAKRDRDEFIDQTVAPFCSNRPEFCRVVRGSDVESYGLGYGGLHYKTEGGPAESNEFIAVEFSRALATPAQPVPTNIIIVNSGAHYEPNSMYTAEGMILEMMRNIAEENATILDGEEGKNPLRFVFLFGVNPDNLNWSATWVRPYGDGPTKAGSQYAGCDYHFDEYPDEYLWQSSLFGDYTQDVPIEDPHNWVPAQCKESQSHRQRFNDDPEVTSFQEYHKRLFRDAEGIPMEQPRLGLQVAAQMGLHGDNSPLAYRFKYDDPYHTNLVFPPSYLISGCSGTIYVTKQQYFEKNCELVRLLTTTSTSVYPHASWLGAYFRPFHQGLPSGMGEDWCDLETVPAAYCSTGQEPQPEIMPDFRVAPLFRFTIEGPEDALYRNSTRLYEEIPTTYHGTYGHAAVVANFGAYNGNSDTFDIDGYIDDPEIYRDWGQSILWAVRETFHDVPLRTLLYCDMDNDHDTPPEANWACLGDNCVEEANNGGDSCHDAPGMDCDDSDPQVSGIAVEQCDGKDNDCDGIIDEGFENVPEICDSEDNDCDGSVDEGFENVLEVCDGVDNDCDSQTDEGLAICDDGDPCNGEEWCEGASGCQKEPDTDGDGLPNADESLHGTDSTNPDTDGDGASDGAEVCSAGDSGCPNPLDTDSDNDTLLDGYEIQQKLNPCDPDSDDDGVNDNEDPLPLDPGVTPEYLEQVLRDQADYINDLSLSLFVGDTTAIKRSRRNTLAAHSRQAANAIANANYNTATNRLNLLLIRIDGNWISPEEDWMYDCNPAPPCEKSELAADVELQIDLIEYF